MKPLVVHGAPGAGHRLIGRCLEAGDVTHELWHLPGKVFRAERYILPIRNPEPNARSILKEGMVREIETARSWVAEARRAQKVLFESPYPAFFVQYEAVVRRGSQWLADRLATFLEVEKWTFDEDVYDGNKQYGGSAK